MTEQLIHGMSTTEYNPEKWALEQVVLERVRQDRKWGRQRHAPERWIAILAEEVGEAAKESLDARNQRGEWTEVVKAYRAELIQVAAVAIAAIAASFEEVR